MGKEALVIERSILLSDEDFQGFLSIEKKDLVSIITNKKNHFYHPRGEE